MAADTLTEAVKQDPLKAGIQIASEVILPLPGGSNLVKGDMKQAVAHAGLGLVARALLGPLGAILVSINSLSVAMTERPVAESLDLAGDTPRTTRTSPEL
jgi:hypothetical protein